MTKPAECGHTTIALMPSLLAACLSDDTGTLWTALLRRTVRGFLQHSESMGTGFVRNPDARCGPAHHFENSPGLTEMYQQILSLSSATWSTMITSQHSG